MKTATPCAARARAIRTLPRSTRESCCAEAAGASRPRVPHTDALFLGGLACRGLGLLGALGRLARFPFRLLLKARAPGLHDVDVLRAGFGRLGQGNALTFLLLLHRHRALRLHVGCTRATARLVRDP